MPDQEAPFEGAGKGTSSGDHNKKRSLPGSARGSSASEPDSKIPATGAKKTKRKVLTAYNVYFRDERKRVLDAGHNIAELYDTEVAPYTRAKRPHNEFQLLVQVISKRWKELSAPIQAKYQAQALAYNSAPDDADAANILAQTALRGSASQSGDEDVKYLGTSFQSNTTNLSGMGKSNADSSHMRSIPGANFGSVSSAFSLGDARMTSGNLQGYHQGTLENASGLPQQTRTGQHSSSKEAHDLQNLIRQFANGTPQDKAFLALQMIRQQNSNSAGTERAIHQPGQNNFQDLFQMHHASGQGRPQDPQEFHQSATPISSSSGLLSQHPQAVPPQSSPLLANETLLKGLLQRLTSASPEEKPILVKAVAAFVRQEMQNPNSSRNSQSDTASSTSQSMIPRHQPEAAGALFPFLQQIQANRSHPFGDEGNNHSQSFPIGKEGQAPSQQGNALQNLMELLRQQQIQNDTSAPANPPIRGISSSDFAAAPADNADGSNSRTAQLNHLLQSLRQPQAAPYRSADPPAAGPQLSQNLSSSQRSGDGQRFVSEAASGPSPQQNTQNQSFDQARIQQILDLLNRQRNAPGPS